MTAAILMVAVISCSLPEGLRTTASPVPSVEAGDPMGLVWEVWGHISRSYARWDNLDLERVQGSAIAGLLEAGQTPPYPFLTDVGRLRGQPPAGVPPEMSDLWRAMVLHQARWPQISADARARAVVAGMVAGLGEPSAVVVPAENYQESLDTLNEAQEGSYVGIGAQFARTEGGQVLLSPMEGSPVQRAGIETGDVLLAVEGRKVAGRNLEELLDLIDGPRGSKVHLSVQRAGEIEPLEFTVFLDDIDFKSVARQIAPGGIGYIRVAQFRENTGSQFQRAMEGFSRLELLALVLDLRTNPGGSLEAAQEVAGYFLDKGEVFLSAEGRSSGRTDYVIKDSPPRPFLEGIPVVVLIDEHTSGEAEALAAALQDNERALLLGKATFGRGSSNELFKLRDGSGIYLPTVRWYRSSGKLVGSGGIQPDVTEPLTENPEGISTDSQFNRAYNILNDILPPFR